MGVLGLHGVRRAKSPRTTRSAPKDECPADLVRRHFSAFRPNELWDRHSSASGRCPLLCTHLLGVGLRRLHHRRVLPANHRLVDLHQPVHRPGPGRPGGGRLATKTSRSRADGPGAPLATAACSTGPFATGPPWPSARRSPLWAPRVTSFRLCPGRGTQLAVQGRAHPLARAPGRTSTPSRSPPPSGSTGWAPFALTPPSGCEPPPSTKPPRRPTPTTTTTARNNHNQQPPALDKPAPTKPRA